jgi:hypothetical protein
MTFEKDHAAGKHQHELVGMMDKLHKALEGHSRALGLIALTRMIAVLLGPAAKKTREDMLEAIPDTVRSILGEMDRMMRNSG